MYIYILYSFAQPRFFCILLKMASAFCASISLFVTQQFPVLDNLEMGSLAPARPASNVLSEATPDAATRTPLRGNIFSSLQMLHWNRLSQTSVLVIRTIIVASHLHRYLCEWKKVSLFEPPTHTRDVPEIIVVAPLHQDLCKTKNPFLTLPPSWIALRKILPPLPPRSGAMIENAPNGQDTK